MNEIFTLSEAAKYLRVAPITLYRMARRGSLPAVKFGRSWRFRQDRLREWLHQKEEGPTQNEVPEVAFRHLSTRESQGVLELIKLLQVQYGERLKKIILYGSRTRGDFHAFSDIDIFVVIQNDDNSFLQAKREIETLVADLNLKKELLLQVVIFPEKEEVQPGFKTFLLIEKIKREGIVLYQNL